MFFPLRTDPIDLSRTEVLSQRVGLKIAVTLSWGWKPELPSTFRTSIRHPARSIPNLHRSNRSSPATPAGNTRGKQCLALFLFLLLAGRLFGLQVESSDLASFLAKAQRAQAANNYAAAAADYRQAAKLRPDIPELQANLGLMQHEAGQYQQAIKTFQRVLRLNPSLYVPNLFLGIDYVRTGRAKEAIPFLLKAEKMNVTDPLPALTLGRAYYSLGEDDLAVRIFRRTVRIDPKQGSAWFALGVAQLDEVEQEARRMTGRYANSSYAQALYAESLVKQSRYKEAASLYKTILASGDQPPCIRTEAGLLDLHQGNPQAAAHEFRTELAEHPQCSMVILGEARLNIAAGHNAAALRLIRQAWERDHGFVAANASMLFENAAPDSFQNFLEYAAHQESSRLLDSGLYATLIDAAGGVVSIAADTRSPASVEHAVPSSAVRDQARRQYLSGHDSACAALLGGSLDTRNASAVELLAACSWLAGDYSLVSDAGRVLESLSSASHAQALYWSIKANEKLAYCSLNHFQQLEPNSAQSHILVGDIYRQRENYDAALKEYKQALAISPENVGALLGLASAYYGNANIAETVRVARKALDLTPDDPEINLLLGEAYSSQHDFSAAEPYLLKALKAKPQVLPHVHALLGEAYAADGKTQEAIRELKLGAGTDQDGSIHYQLARLYIKIGDRSDAQTALRQTKLLEQKLRQRAVIALQDAPRSKP